MDGRRPVVAWYDRGMSMTVLATKLYVPPPRRKVVTRPRLIDRLNEGRKGSLTLISAPAGSGKTTLVSQWAATCGLPVAWLSLDEADSEPTRFLTHLAAALRTVSADIGTETLAMLQSPQPPPTVSVLTSLLNEVAMTPNDLILVLDDYHLVDSKEIDGAVTFLLDHLPPQLHIVIATREDPLLPLSRYRVQGRLCELRSIDLRFTFKEAAEFLNRVMDLNLSAEDVAALEGRTEGWVAGLQLAALSMQRHQDTAGFIRSYSGGHRLVLDYLVEEVLQQQPERVQAFMLATSILDRLCGPLCEAVAGTPSGTGQDRLTALERANLFVVPLDDERVWFRYHHLFSELLRKRLGQSLSSEEIAGLHVRASEWFEINDLTFDAFRHAVSANDLDRAERLIESPTIGLHLRSVAGPVLDWLASLPKPVLDARPRLRVRSATLALMVGQTSGVENKLQAAEAALAARTTMVAVESDGEIRELIGEMACARATLGLFRYDPVTMVVQARRALEYLSSDNLVYRFTANWALASALLLQGDRAGAASACQESIAISRKSGHVFSQILAMQSMGQIYEMDNQLHQAEQTYRQALLPFGDHPQPNASVALVGLTRIYYQWNELEVAEQHAQQSLQLAQRFDRTADRFVVSEVLLARLRLARGDVDGAAALLAQTEESARRGNLRLRLPEIAAAQITILLRQGRVEAADRLVRQFELPLCRARVALAQGYPTAALAVLEPFRRQMEDRGWADERLKAMCLRAVVLHAQGAREEAMRQLDEALVVAEPAGIVRLFVDEGLLMAQLLAEAVSRCVTPDYAKRLLTAFATGSTGVTTTTMTLSLVEHLSKRELEVLRMIAQGLSNQEIGKRLFLAVDTVKGHNRRIFDKLQVRRRTEAIARARELGLL